MTPLLLALLLSADETLPAEETPAAPTVLRWAITPGVGFGQETVGTSALWGDLEVSLRVLRWLRCVLDTSGGWVPFPLARFPGANGPTRGAFRFAAGADFLAPVQWGHLFLGVSAGLDHTNLLYEVFDSGEDPHDRVRFLWFDRWCVLLRAGVDVPVSEHVALGGNISLSIIELNGVGGELHGRLSFFF